MKYLKYILSLIVILNIFQQFSFAQNYADKSYYLVDSLDWDALSKEDRQLVDSCLSVYYQVKEDTLKNNALYAIVDGTWDKNVYPKYSQIVYDFSKSKLDNEKDIILIQYYKRVFAEAAFNLGYYAETDKKINKALKYYNESLDIYKELNNKGELAEQYLRNGFLYNLQGDISLAIDNYYKALKISKELNNKRIIAGCYINIGTSFNEQKDYNTALEYFIKSLKVYEELKYIRGIATANNNIGFIKKTLNDYPKALEYYFNNLEICKDGINDKERADACHNIAGTYSTMGELDKALEYYNKSIDYRIKVDDRIGLTVSYATFAGTQLKLGNISEAKKYSNIGFELGSKINYLRGIKDNAIILSKVAEKQKDHKKALEMYKLYIQMRDSLKNESTQKAVAQQQAKYEYEKQKAVDDAEHEKQIAIEQEAKEKQTILTYATAGGLGLVGIFLLVVFNRLKVTRKQKGIIEEQKEEVEKQKTVVEIAHTELEEKNKEITDSIQYAKRIQSAILPPSKVVKEYLQESFIYYKPKDIVAGDFYWLEQTKNKVLFAAADCTGHGVPGAMVSVVCNNGLNRSVREYGLTDPGKILDKTREIVVQEFEKSEEEVKDGMDIALCSLEGNKLKYAGAHNPLWIIRPVRHSAHDAESPNNQITGQARNDEYELIETKANKQPIGQFDNPEPYTTHTLELQKGDSLYIFSDGYADQFGGDNGKKLKTTNFKKLLLSIQKESMEKQKQLIDEAFEDWKGDLEQLDDVCVIGVRI